MEQEPSLSPQHCLRPMGLEAGGPMSSSSASRTQAAGTPSTTPDRSTPAAPRNARTVGASLLRDGDALLEEAMEVGLSGTASFLPSGTFSTPFSRDE